MATVEIEELSKVYADGGDGAAALRDVSLSAHGGEAVALVGANGAGKSTLLAVLSTLLRPSSGRVSVAGFDLVRDPDRVREVIGVVRQEVTVDPVARVHDLLRLHARLAGLSRSTAERRVAEVLELTGLERARRRRARELSGGMCRKLDIGLALISEPPVLLLDEPTDSLDPLSRHDLWTELSRLRDSGTCILFASQDGAEVKRLADRVMVLADGRLVRRDLSPLAAGRTWASDAAALS